MIATISETFRLSRIYAEGWNAANGLATGEVDALDLAKLTTLNPHALETDRSRWTSGFTKALATERPRAKTKGTPMKPLVRFGRKIPIPSSLQVRHELRSFIAEENVRELCAEAEGMSSSATWEEICAHRVRVAEAKRETTTG